MPQPLRVHLSLAFAGDGSGQPPARLPDLLGRSAPALALAALLGLAVAADLPWSSALRLFAGLLLTQVLPGALIWRALRPPDGSWFEDLAVGFALGSVLAMATQALAGTLQTPWLSAGVPAGVVITLIAVPACRRRIRDAHTSWEPWWFGPLTGLATLGAIPPLLAYFRDVPLTWATGVRQPDVDAYLHLALAGELAHRGPATFPWVASEPLAYHWFSHAWIANLSVVSGVELDQTLFRFMPAFLPLAVTLIVSTAAVRLSGKAWTGPVAAVLTLAGGDLNVFGRPTTNHPLDPLSPSLGLSVPILVALVVVLVCRWRGEARPGAFLLVPVLAFAVAGTKGSALPLVIAGLVVSVLAAALVNRPYLRRLVAELAVIVACFAFALLVVFHGSAGGLTIDLRNAPRALPLFEWLGGGDTVVTNGDQALVSLLVVFGVLARGSGMVFLFATGRGRRDPLTWFLAGAGCAGAGALAVLAHPGASQLYFAYNAIPLLALGSAAGLATLAERLGDRVAQPMLTGLVAGVLMVLLPPLVAGVLSPGGQIPQALREIGIAGAVVAAGGLLTWLTMRPRSTELAGTAPSGAALAGAAVGGTALAGTVVVTLLVAGIATVANTATMTIPKRPVPPQAQEVSRGQIDAARWIRDHSAIDDLVITNRHCSTPVAPYHCDSRRFVVSAFSERQVLVEGWTGTPRASTLAPVGAGAIFVSYWKPDLLALNDGFIARPDAIAAARLRELGVRWVLVDFTRPHAGTLEPYAHLKFRTRDAEVYQLPATR